MNLYLHGCNHCLYCMYVEKKIRMVRMDIYVLEDDFLRRCYEVLVKWFSRGFYLWKMIVLNHLQMDLDVVRETFLVPFLKIYCIGIHL